jgi:hypothetical protein
MNKVPARLQRQIKSRNFLDQLHGQSPNFLRQLCSLLEYIFIIDDKLVL